MQVACHGAVVHCRDGRKHTVIISRKMKQESVQNFSNFQGLLFLPTGYLIHTFPKKGTRDVLYGSCCDDVRCIQMCLRQKN